MNLNEMKFVLDLRDISAFLELINKSVIILQEKIY